MNNKHLIKASNSKGKLVKAVMVYQRALSYYADESHWAVKSLNLDLIHTIGKLAKEEGEAWRLAHPELMDAYRKATEHGEDVILWVKDDDPTLPAQQVLGLRKIVREPDKKSIEAIAKKTVEELNEQRNDRSS